MLVCIEQPLFILPTQSNKEQVFIFDVVKLQAVVLFVTLIYQAFDRAPLQFLSVCVRKVLIAGFVSKFKF